MNRLTVIVTARAQVQLDEQLDYIARDSVMNAVVWNRRLRVEINKLGDVHGFAIDEDASDRAGIVVRKLAFEHNYLIFFHVDEVAGRVEVISFRHGARQPRGTEP